MKSAQLEMGFTNGSTSSTPHRSRRRQQRAHWWFERMREVVERACDWEQHPAPRPEQIWLSGASRPVNLDRGCEDAALRNGFEFCA